MGKVAAAVAATGVTGTGAAGIYGAHKMGWFEGSDDQLEQQYNGLYIAPEKTKFKKQKNVYCLGTIGGVFDQLSHETIDGNNPPDISNKDDAKLDDSGETLGCLMVNWNTPPKDQQWTGANFRFVWTVSRGTKGFAVYMTVNTKNTQVLEFDGVSYVFKKENDGKWKTTHKLDMTMKKTIFSSSDIQSKFPLKDTSLTGNGSNGISNKYWDFLDDNATKLKGGATHKYGFWKFTSQISGGQQKEDLKKWTTNLGTWWNNFFGREKWDMESVVNGIQGQWSSPLLNTIGG